MKHVQWLEDDFMVVLQAIGGLLVLIVGGIMVAEKAVIDLTGYEQQIEFINLRIGERGIYTFYLLGKSITLQSLFDIGHISSLNRKLFLDIGDRAFVINTCPTFEIHSLLAWLAKQVIALKQGLYLLLSLADGWFAAGRAWLADFLSDFAL
ncbi:MAG: hypothetical protein AAGU23_02200 [Bacillota bacterium]